MKKPLLVGVTGGIGSGKTVVTKIFSILGSPIYNADQKARDLVNTDLNLRQEIIQLLGEEAYDVNGYDSRYVASKVFSDKDTLHTLNSIIHPAVARDFDRWVSGFNSQKYLVKEAALLFESGSYSSLDFTILVTAPIEIRIDRVLKRDTFRSESEVRDIISNQWTEEKKTSIADFMLVNSESQLLFPQILELHRRFSSY